MVGGPLRRHQRTGAVHPGHRRQAGQRRPARGRARHDLPADARRAPARLRRPRAEHQRYPRPPDAHAAPAPRRLLPAHPVPDPAPRRFDSGKLGPTLWIATSVRGTRVGPTCSGGVRVSGLGQLAMTAMYTVAVHRQI